MTYTEALKLVIQAVKEAQQYREMERKLEEAYGKCDGLLEVVVDNLYLHKGRDIGKPRKATLLTDDSVDMWEAYKQIGTVEECREAVEKQKAKKSVDYDEDFGYFVCPSCGSTVIADEFSDHKFCLCCGQALMWEEREEE